MVDEVLSEWAEGRVDRIAAVLQEQGSTLAVAESLTGGLVTEVLARGPNASQWLRGGVVAYATEVKHELLGVRPGPVVSESAALDMAVGAARVLGGDIGLAVTGSGGPEPQDGQPPGTVWLAVHRDGTTRAELHRFSGAPPTVCDASCRAMVALLQTELRLTP